MRIVIVEPEKRAYVQEIDHSLESMQKVACISEQGSE